MLDQQPRRGAGEAERDRAVRDRRLLRHAGAEVGVGAPQALRRGARDRLDLPLELRVDVKADAEPPRHHLHGAVVVGRAEAAGDEAGVRLQAVPQCLGELVRGVADDRDPRGLEPEAQRLAGEEGAVQVCGDDDDRARARQLGARAVRVGVT